MSQGISFKVDPVQLENITKRLDGISYKAPTVLKDAANKTGKKALELLQEGVEKDYTYSRADKLKNHLKWKSATYANPRVILDVKSNMNEIIDFDVTDREPMRWFGYSPQSVGHVRSDTSKKPLTNDAGNKAFVTQFKSGHVSVVARVAKTGKEIRKLSSPSYTHMATRVWEDIEDDVNKMLRANIDKNIAKVLEIKNG